MQKLRDYPIFDFTGGLVTNRSTYQLKDNELMYLRNAELQPGRMTKRLGSKMFGYYGDSPDNDEVPSYGTTILNQMFIANQNSTSDNGMVYYLAVGYITSDSTAGASTLNVTGAGNLQASGNVEIDGYVVAYTGNTGTTLTGCSGNSVAFSAGKAVRQFRDLYGGTRDTTSGSWFSFLGGSYVISHGAQGGYVTVDAALTVTNRLSSGAPKCIVNYKQRIYGIDSSVAYRVDFTELNDPSSFPLANNFDVEDDKGENLCNLTSYGGRLIIWKPNSAFYYNLTQLQQIEDHPGTYNDETVKKVNGLLYILGPRGIYATNTASFKNIGETVQNYLDALRNKWLVNGGQFSAPEKPRVSVDGNKVIFYLGTLTVDQEDFTKISLVYDTIHKYWFIRDGFNSPTGFVFTNDFKENHSVYSNVVRADPQFFFFDQQRMYRVDDDFSFAQTSSTVPGTGTRTGTIITQDRLNNGSGVSIPMEMRTKFYHQNAPGWWKRFGYVRVFAESWPFNIDVRTITATGYSQWKSLGQVTGPNQVFKADIEGYAIQARIIEDSKNDPCILNGLILEETLTLSQNHK